MTKLVKIEENQNLKCNKSYKEYLNPDYIYIPYDETYELLVKGKEEVVKNKIILAKKDKYIYSSISGIIAGICDNIVNNKKQKTIVIENNFKEKSKISGIKDIKNLSKEEIVKRIRNLNAFEGSLNGDIMIINGIDLDVYEENMSYLTYAYADKILECIDILYNVLNIKKCFFAIKNNDSENIDILVNQIGTYPNIDLRLMQDYYPLGHKEIITKELIKDYKEQKIVYFTVEDIYNIYNVLKKNQPITEKIITITGNSINKPKILKVKIGTRIADIIQNEFKITRKDYKIIINGLLSGYEIESFNACITKEIRSIFIQNDSEEKENSCINCGLCHLCCPVNANPRNNKEGCIKCNLCSYVCPSKINLKKVHNE